MSTDTTRTLTELAETPGTHRAVVIGASMGGLLVARILADHFAEVLVFDRDALPASPAHRKNIPQGHHVHALLARGRMSIERLFPGIGAELVLDGAVDANTRTDLTWYQLGGYHATPRQGQAAFLQSRPLLEFHVRRRVSMLPNVAILDGCRVTGLLASRGDDRVSGMQVAHGDEPDGAHEIGSALTVDASGRGSRLPQWLAAIGFDVPEESSAGVDARYTTRFFHRDPGGNARHATVIVASAENRRGGVALAQEGGRWLVTLASRSGAQPPASLPAFVDWAGSLETQDIFEIVRNATPLDEGVLYHFSHSTRRHYERMARFPSGLLPAGDAICSFNPIYGQGMTIAAIEAEQLGACLAEGTADLARRYFARIEAPVDAAWKLAAAGDLRYSDAPIALPRTARMINAYMTRLLVAAQVDPVVSDAFQRVQNLVDFPPRLLRPSIAIRVATASLRRPQHRPADHPEARSVAPREVA